MYELRRRAIRSLHSGAASECVSRLTRFNLHPPKSVDVEFNDGNSYSLSAEFLRVYSPAADSKIRSIDGEKVISGRRHVGIMSAEPIGNYGIRILFDDLHKTGIYTWDYFYHLGTNKFSLMRNYVKTLKKHGLSRDPPPRRNLLSSPKTFRKLKTLTTNTRQLSTVAVSGDPESRPEDPPSSSFSFSETNKDDDNIYVKAPKIRLYSDKPDTSSVTMPMSFMTGSIVGKRFYKQVTTREADDGNGWTVMLDYRTLKTPSKRPLKCPSRALAMAIAAEWEYQLNDGIRPFTMPLMQLACTALERVPLTRPKIIEHLMKKFHQDLVFCRAPGDSDLTRGLRDRQAEKIDPLLKWLETEFGCKPVVYSCFFGGKQDDGLVSAVQGLLKKTDDCELAAIDAIAAAAHSFVIAIGIFRGKLQIEEAVELARLEEDLQIDKWGLVEGGHDIDIADLRVQVSSAAVFIGLSRRS